MSSKNIDYILPHLQWKEVLAVTNCAKIKCRLPIGETKQGMVYSYFEKASNLVFKKPYSHLTFIFQLTN